MGYRLGIDIGGTFTDFALLSEQDGRMVIHKQLTTPADPSRSVLTGIPVLLDKAGVRIDQVHTAVHGTTLVTNAVIERRGAATGILCSKGFADIFDIARERRYDMYDLRITYPRALVPRRRRAEIDERVTAGGAVSRAIDLAEARGAIAGLIAEHGIEALAVCFLNSHANAAHERAVAELAATEFPELHVSTSADVLPLMREYERWSTTAMNAYARPMLDRYLDGLETGLAGLGFTGSLFVMSSSGGTLTPATARRYPVRLLESGPAAGVLQSVAVGRRLDRRNLLSYDMGGTTAKGALVRDGAPIKGYETEVARVHEFKEGSGLPVKIPVIDLIEIGAGGGSIAEVDLLGIIRVGPRSAGADPGPACYGRGGDKPTLTDANLLLGYLSDTYFLGGEMALDKERAARVARRDVAAPLAVEDVRAAWGIHETVNEDVARAFRSHASERGFDYRSCAMIAFGGSGPAHACRVARKLRVPTVVFPPAAGVMSAVGLLASPLSFEIVRTERVEVGELNARGLEGRFVRLFDEARASLAAAAADEVSATRRLDMRYRGQGYEIEVTLPDVAADKALARLPELFTEAYARVFAKSFPEQPIEIVNWKLEAAAPAPSSDAGTRLDATGGAEAIKDRRAAYFPERGGLVACPVYDRYALAPGARFPGPALVEERESTCVIGAGDEATVDRDMNLVVRVALEGRDR